jgi:hypothetical protein
MDEVTCFCNNHCHDQIQKLERPTNLKVYESKEIKGPKQVVQDQLMLPRCLLVKGDKSYF